MSIPTPRTGKDLESILGSFNFVRGHIPHYGEVAGPLYHFHKEKLLIDNEEWHETGAPLFERLKIMMQSPIVLKTYNNTLPLHLKTDASETGFG
eukprot:Awhi_evm1s8160